MNTNFFYADNTDMFEMAAEFVGMEGNKEAYLVRAIISDYRGHYKSYSITFDTWTISVVTHTDPKKDYIHIDWKGYKPFTHVDGQPDCPYDKETFIFYDDCPEMDVHGKTIHRGNGHWIVEVSEAIHVEVSMDEMEYWGDIDEAIFIARNMVF